MIVFGVLVITVAGAMSSVVTVPKLKLLDGREMPAIALGTFLGFKQGGVVQPKNKEVRDAVLQAIDMGYRHFDTASIYGTEAEVGEAINMKIEEGVVTRRDIFITTKVWNTQHRRDQVAVALKDSLEKLGVQYVDLYLMHWPIGLHKNYSYSEVDYMETWKGMEDMQRLGLVRSIGLSNFNAQQLKRVIQKGTVKPVALEIEIHPQNVHKEIVYFAQCEGIVVMGYSPFGSMVLRYGVNFAGPKMDSPLLQAIGERHGKTPAQVVLRWQVDRGLVPIPKTVTPSRLLENINIFDFKLDSYDIEMINQYDTRMQYTLPSFWQTHPHYPFEKVWNPLPDPFIQTYNE